MYIHEHELNVTHDLMIKLVMYTMIDVHTVSILVLEADQARTIGADEFPEEQMCFGPSTAACRGLNKRSRMK